MHSKILIVGLITLCPFRSSPHLPKVLPEIRQRVEYSKATLNPPPEAIYIIKFIAVIFLIIGALLVVYGGFFDWIDEFLGLNL